MSIDVAVVGAGPAGATLAHEVAKAGGKVALFDDRAPWEKPCGGILGRGTLEENSILHDYPHAANEYHGVKYVSPHAECRFAPSPYPIPVVSRRELAVYLLDRARHAGATFRSERVLAIERSGSRWELRWWHLSATA